MYHLSLCVFEFPTHYIFVSRVLPYSFFFFFSSRRRHTRLQGDWSSDVCSSDLGRRVQRRPAQARLLLGGKRDAGVFVLAGAHVLAGEDVALADPLEGILEHLDRKSVV